MAAGTGPVRVIRRDVPAGRIPVQVSVPTWQCRPEPLRVAAVTPGGRATVTETP
jgi:hypothetical protein